MISRTKYVGWCWDCRSLCEFSDDRACPRTRYRGTVLVVCYARIALLRNDDEVARAVLAAHRIGGWNAAVAVWQEAGMPALGWPLHCRYGTGLDSP